SAIVGTELQRTVAVGDRLGRPAENGLVGAAIVERVGKIRLELDRRVVVGDRAVVLALVCIGGAPIDEGFGISRLEPDRSIIVGNGAVKLALVEIGSATPEEIFGLVRSREPTLAQAAIVVGDRLVIVARPVRVHGLLAGGEILGAGRGGGQQNCYRGNE